MAYKFQGLGLVYLEEDLQIEKIDSFISNFMEFLTTLHPFFYDPSSKYLETQYFL